MRTTYDLPERNAYLYPHDPDNPDSPPKHTAEFRTDIRAIERDGDTWITIANLSLSIGITGSSITLTTYPLHLEGEDALTQHVYHIGEIEEQRNDKQDLIYEWTGEPYEPYSAPPPLK